MGAYVKSVKCTFWTDARVQELTKEARLLYIHLITSPCSNLSGCWEQSFAVSSFYTGLSKEEVERAIEELEKNGMIRYDRETYEVLLLNYSKHNWGCSPTVRSNVRIFAEGIKARAFSEFVFALLDDAENCAKNRREIIDEMKRRREEK